MKKLLPSLLLSIGLIVLGAWAVLSTRNAARAEHTLNETYLASLGESAELMQSLSLSMEKALLSRDASQTASLLSQISGDAGDLRRALAILPFDEETLSPAMSLADDIADDVAAFLSELVTDGGLSPASRDALSGYLTRCTLLSGKMALTRQEVLSGQRSLLDAAPAQPSEAPRAVTRLPDAKGLPQTQVTAGQAMTLAQEFVGQERVTGVAQAPDMLGPIAAWGITVDTVDVALNVYVTQIGGKVLLMAPETASFQELLTVDQCREAAAAFLNTRGLRSMESEFHQVYDGLCVLTFVYAQGDVLIYPDRVTVQVRMDTGEIVGFEASAYWQNHTPRRLAAPALTVGEARALLAPEADEQSVRLCLFPEGDRETLCWQFTVSHQDETFLIYLDAKDGREVALQKLILLENGVMAA